MSTQPAPVNDPYRPPHFSAGRVAPRKTITYGELIGLHCARLEEIFKNKGAAEEKAAQTKLNHLSAINGWMDHRGLGEDSPVGDEFGRDYEAELARHLVHLKSKRHNRQGKAVAGLKDSTIRNRTSLLAHWRATWETETEVPTSAKPRETIHQALDRLVRLKGVTPYAFAKAVGVHHNVFSGWHGGTHRPYNRKSTLEAFGRIERYCDLDEGELTSLIRPGMPRVLGEDGLPRSAFSERRSKTSAEKYKLGVFPPDLKAEYDEWFRLMTALLEPDGPLKRNGFWFLDRETGECPTAGRIKNSLAGYFGYLCLPVEGRHFPVPRKKGDREEDEPRYTVVCGEGFDEASLTLALVGDVPLVRRYLDFMCERAGGVYNNETRHFLNLCCALLRRNTGFVRQHPDYGARLSPPVSANKWHRWCDSAHERLRDLLRNLEANGLIVQSRDVEEPIEFILTDPHPVRYLYELADLMQEDLPPAKCEKAVAYRDMFLVRFLTANPLRIRHFSVMTWRADNTGNLYQERDGSWWLRFSKDAFKNRRSLKKKDKAKKYRAPLPQSLWPYVETYLSEYRPLLLGVGGCDYVFRPATRGGTLKHKTGDTKPMKPGSLSDVLRINARHYLRCMGFGSHAYRHIVATDYLKNHPGGVMIAASILHDQPETILKYYGHLQHADYFGYWITYHEEQLETSRTARQKEVAA